MSSTFDIREVVPHSGVMSLLDEVIEHNEQSLCAQVTITEDSLFLEPRGVPTWVGIEYMAQAIAAYSGILARNAGQQISVGFLVGTRKYIANQGYFSLGSTLRISVFEELRGDNGLGVFRCNISGNGVVASANLSVFQPKNLDDFLNPQRAEVSE